MGLIRRICCRKGLACKQLTDPSIGGGATSNQTATLFRAWQHSAIEFSMMSNRGLPEISKVSRVSLLMFDYFIAKVLWE
jgi:hypothetical protein